MRLVLLVGWLAPLLSAQMPEVGVATLKGHQGTITTLAFAAGLAFSPDGKTLASGGIDRNVTLTPVAKMLAGPP